MDAKELVKIIPTWLIAVVVFAFLLLFVERVYISQKPFWLFGQQFGPMDDSVRLPQGSIIIWDAAARETSGVTTGRTVPLGWQICDGTNGAPDLRQHTLRGASAHDDAGRDYAIRRGLDDKVPLTFAEPDKEDRLLFYGVYFLCRSHNVS